MDIDKKNDADDTNAKAPTLLAKLSVFASYGYVDCMFIW